MRGSKHVYLGMNIEFKEDGSVVIDMKEYVNDILKEFLIKFKSEGKNTFLAGHTMFSNDTSQKMNKHRRELFHRFVAKALFLCKGARLNIQPIVAVLCTRTKSPSETDWSSWFSKLNF